MIHVQLVLIYILALLKVGIKVLLLIQKLLSHQDSKMLWGIVSTLERIIIMDSILQKNAFLCAENSIETSILFTKKISSGFFGGEGFILQKATGNGMLFLEIDGDSIIKELGPGEVIKVDTGNVVAFEPSVSYEIETVKGLGNIFLGGEGLFLTRLVGPGKVILQSQNFKDFAGRIIPYIPQRSN